MKLIIVTNSEVTEVAEKNALTAFLEAKDWSVWHWFQDLWLVDGAPDRLSIMNLRDEIKEAIPTLRHVFIIRHAEGSVYSARVPTASIPWLHEHWKEKR